MAYSVITPLPLGQAAITTGVTTLYTVPASTRTFFKQMSICNTTGGALTVDVYLVPNGGSAGTTNAMLYGNSIAANATLDWSGSHILDAGATIQIKASNTGLTITASGGEAV